ncbi:MAG: hypothetical protein D3M94_07375 [Rhodocyclales bacterium GT-UBC]|nr:MAG: hypothetical protein D3M94_07375 [Rhodocyclales bacterium GT-UBC]
MSEHRTLRAAIVAQLQTVVDIGAVYAYERYAKDDAAFREIYAGGTGILGWHVRRVARKEASSTNEVLTTWEIRGFANLQDSEESELQFDELIDRICDAWRSDPRMGNAVLYPGKDIAPVPELVDAGPAMFCGVLCHSARLRLVTRTVIKADRPWD